MKSEKIDSPANGLGARRHILQSIPWLTTTELTKVCFFFAKILDFSGEKVFPCEWPGCEKKYSRKDEMVNHYRTKHEKSGAKLNSATPTRPNTAVQNNPSLRNDSNFQKTRLQFVFLKLCKDAKSAGFS